MKKFKVFIALMCIILLFSGCNNFRIAASIDDLIAPVSPSGDNAGVQNAVDEYSKGGYSLKIPVSGEYTTSFIFRDLDGDKINEAVAFYEPSSKPGSICLAVIDKTDDKWSVVENIDGVATDVNSVDFCDLNGDGRDEIIVCWSVVSKSIGSTISVFVQDKDNNAGYRLKEISKAVSASNFHCVDMNNDGVNELLTFSNGTFSESPKAELYSYKNEKKSLLGTTKLDGSITSFESISCAETDDGMTVFADAIKSDGSSMVTELIYWSTYYNSIVSPFYSYSSGRTKETSRNNLVTCRDIDNDGAFEIPTDASFSKLPADISVQNWKEYANTVLLHKCYSISCKRDGIIVVIPDDIFKKIKVEYNSEERKIKVVSKKDNQDIFEIVTLIKSSYDSKDERYAGYTNILSDSGFVYLVKTNPKSDIQFDLEALKEMIKPY